MNDWNKKGKFMHGDKSFARSIPMDVRIDVVIHAINQSEISISNNIKSINWESIPTVVVECCIITPRRRVSHKASKRKLQKIPEKSRIFKIYSGFRYKKSFLAYF